MHADVSITTVASNVKSHSNFRRQYSYGKDHLINKNYELTTKIIIHVCPSS